MFLTQEKALKKILQERHRGDLNKALQRALEAFERWPQYFEISLEAVQLSLETSDFKGAVALMKSALRNHPQSRDRILGIAREALHQAFNPLLASFAIEFLLRGRDIDAAREILRIGPRNYVTEMINRSQTRSSGFERQDGSEGFIENELLLGLLLIEAGRFDDALEPLGRVLARSPENARLFGSLIIEIERERPQSAEVQFQLGLASTLLEHPDKAEARFFRALELENAPAGRIAEVLETASGHSKNHLLLRGEALVESGRAEEGIELIRRHVSGQTAAGNSETDEDGSARAQTALARLERLIAHHGLIELALLYGEISAGLGRVREAVESLERHYELDPESAARLVACIEGNAALSGGAPAQVFLTRLLIEGGDYESAAQAARRAAEIDPAASHALLKIIGAAAAADAGGDPALPALQAELLARCGDGERACEIIKNLSGNEALPGEELLRLSGEVLRHAGLNLEAIAATIEVGIRSGTIDEVLPFALEFYRRDQEAHAELASRTATCAGNAPEGWKHAARLCDLIAEQEQLDRPLRLLQAQAHLHGGEIERAVFEFDQLIMFDENLRCDLIEMYERAAADHPRNTTLHLALYQLYFEEERFACASRHLAGALESDPAQIRDVMQRFDRLVERDAGNRAVWEELLRAALRMNHIELARETLARAVRTLSEPDAAALHIFGARISCADNRIDEALSCLAKTLESPDANLREVEEQLLGVSEREPDSAKARLLLGQTLLRLGAEERAAAEFERCLELDVSLGATVRERLERQLPLSIMPWRISRLLGEIAWAEARLDEAYRLFESAQKGPPESLAGLAQSLEKLRREHPEDAQLALTAARCLALTGRCDDALALLEPLAAADGAHAAGSAEISAEIIAREPLHPGANRLLARLLTRAGDKEGALQALLRIAAATGAAAQGLVEMIEEFLPAHGGDPRLLVPLGELRCRADNHSGALADLRAALELDPDSRDAILALSSRIDWPAACRGEALLLEADSLIAGGFMRDAFDRLERIETSSRPGLEALLERLQSIIDKDPAREHYLLAGKLIALGGDTDAAEACLRRGADRLGEADSTELLIALGEMLHGAGRTGRAAACFREVLASGGDRERILRRIETARGDWVRGEIERGLERIAAGAANADEARRTAEIALEAGDIEAARRSIAACGHASAARILRARMHLAAGSPLLALAAVRGAADGETERDLRLELLYIEGIAQERLDDFGRAAAVFSSIAAIDGAYRDCESRALAAYTNYLSAPDGEFAGVLVAVSDLGRGTGKEQP